MTINYTCISDNIRSYRLPFGVPLEDIFPERDLHPYLKNIFRKAFNDISSNGYSIQDVICKLQGNVAERLVLKEIVTLCKPMPLEYPPGALLWILRHFIGLLPVPLLPEYTNKEYFSWRKLSLFCKRSFLKYTAVETIDKLVIQKLAEELCRLPSVNFLLFCVLLNFIRALSSEQNKYGKANFNRITAFCLVKYFSSSIFIRPYRPGRNGKIDRHYFPLLFYLVLKWPEVEKHFGRQNSTHSIASKKISKSKGYFRQSAQKIRIKDTFTQTDNDFESYSRYDWLETISEESFEKNIDFLRDTACQTESCITKFEEVVSPSESIRKTNFDEKPHHLIETACKSYKYTTKYEDNINAFACGKQCFNENKSDSDIVDFLRDVACQTDDCLNYKRIRCCCTYGSNYKSYLNSNRSLDKECQTSSIKSAGQECFGENYLDTATENLNNEIESACKTNPFLDKHCQTNHLEDIYEESTGRVTNRRSISTVTEQELLYRDNETQLHSNSVLKNDVATNTNSIFYGWISPTISSKSPRNKLDFCSPHTFSSENEYIYDDYAGSTLNLLGDDIEETRSKEEDLLGRIAKIGWTYTPPRSVCVTSPIESPIATSTTTMKDENYILCFNNKEQSSKEEKECSSAGGSLKSTGSGGSAKNKKTFTITHFKNKLDFLKFFTGKRKKLKNSCSFDEISTIKYKKMNSVKSTLF